MSNPKTLRSMAGEVASAPLLSESSILVIDAQNEYVDGPLRLHGVNQALEEISVLLSRARDAGAPIVHIQHEGRVGGLFDINEQRGQFAPEAMPLGDEKIIRKKLPNAFTGTELQATLSTLDRHQVLVVGFMTHMCISSTVRAALDLQVRCAVIASATATRNLPGVGNDQPVLAAQVQRGCLAALADRFAMIVPSVADIQN